VELAFGCLVLDADVCDVGARGAPVAPLYEAFNHLLAALDDGLDVAVGHVTDPAFEVKLAG